MARKKKVQKKTVDFQQIKNAASGRWSEIIQSLCSIPAHYLDGRHQGCPICGQGKDRWRVFDNFEETGGAICNQCGPNLGDGIKVVAWQRNCSQFEAAVAVAQYVGIEVEGDWQRINVLQEWAGYLLLPDTGEQRFMILTGEGANGKSVFCGGIEAMLGPANCSHVQFERLNERFQDTATLGKLANICADVSDHEMMGEGVIKSFRAGDRMTFDRKGIEPIEAAPTARLMLACNNLPRTKDRSEGFYRRILLIPWNRRVPEHEKIVGMDKVEYWQQSGELPGIFKWALLGLSRLREQKGFSPCEAMDKALGRYRRDNNPALEFIESHLQAADVTSDGPALKTKYLFQRYRDWCDENNMRPLNRVHFARELGRRFSGCKSVQRRDRGSEFRSTWASITRRAWWIIPIATRHIRIQMGGSKNEHFDA